MTRPSDTTVGRREPAPTGTGRHHPQGTPHAGRWTTWGSWSLGALALLANVVQVAGAVTTTPILVVGIAAGLAALAGGAGLWILAAHARWSPGRTPVFVLSVASVAISSGVLGYLLPHDPHRGDHTETAAPGATPSSPFTRDPSPRTGNGTAGSATPFTGTATFTSPANGNTLFSGDTVSGTVHDWADGFQIWLFIHGEDGRRAAPHGPCTVTGATWTCANVPLLGATGARDTVDLVIAPDTTAQSFRGGAAGTVTPPAKSFAQIQVYKG